MRIIGSDNDTSTAHLFSSDGRFLASAPDNPNSSTSTIIIWDNIFNCVRILEGQTSEIIKLRTVIAKSLANMIVKVH